MGDAIALFDRLNLSPFNTVLLAVLAFLLRKAASDILRRLARAERRNRKQDRALARLEQHLDLDPLPDDDGDR